MWRKYLVPVLACALLAGCGKPAGEAKAPEPTALVKTVAANAGALDDLAVAYGRVEFDPNALQTLVAPVEARIASLDVAVGQQVAAGQVVATLSASPGSVLEADKAERDARAAQTDYERLARLRADGLAANNDVETARAAASTAQETARSLRARTGGGTIVLRATTSGVVDTLPSAVGDLIPSGGPVVKLGGSGPMRARLGVDPAGLPRMAPGQMVRIGPVSGEGASFVGRIQSIDRRVNPTTRLAGVLVALPAGSGFLPGQALKAEVVVGHRGGGVVVPRAAVLYEGEAPYLFVAVGGKAVKRDVKLGVDDGTNTEVLDGVTAGEKVVTEGGAALEDGMKLREGALVENSGATADKAKKP